ncbi:diphthine synthase [Candidatus Pacearchaeota archaeon]|nr:diphthine synthase [Candidatus Pacearchaeota archaeon]
MLYLIGLGLNARSISKEGLDILKTCKKIYLENYTVDFPYSINELEDIIGKKIISADREKVESLEIVDEAKKMEIALLIYGSPLTATTHISLIQEAKALKIKYKIIYNASIIDAVAETGLQLYKFGKIASMPKWNPEENFMPESFMEIIQQNMSMKAHSLILCDIGLDFQEAVSQLKKSSENCKFELKNKKIVVCQALGTRRSKIFYKNFEELKELEDIQKPFSIIIPSKLHFLEKEVLEGFE